MNDLLCSPNTLIKQTEYSNSNLINNCLLEILFIHSQTYPQNNPQNNPRNNSRNNSQNDSQEISNNFQSYSQNDSENSSFNSSLNSTIENISLYSYDNNNSNLTFSFDYNNTNTINTNNITKKLNNKKEKRNIKLYFSNSLKHKKNKNYNELSKYMNELLLDINERFQTEFIEIEVTYQKNYSNGTEEGERDEDNFIASTGIVSIYYGETRKRMTKDGPKVSREIILGLACENVNNNHNDSTKNSMITFMFRC